MLCILMLLCVCEHIIILFAGKHFYLHPKLNKLASKAAAAQKHCARLPASLRRKCEFSSELSKKSSLLTDFSTVLCLTFAIFLIILKQFKKTGDDLRP